jgi:Protein of unknown function (DUF952)
MQLRLRWGGQDGFIHLTEDPALLMTVANSFFINSEDDWLCLELDPAKVQAEVTNALLALPRSFPTRYHSVTFCFPDSHLGIFLQAHAACCSVLNAPLASHLFPASSMCCLFYLLISRAPPFPFFGRLGRGSGEEGVHITSASFSQGLQG